MNIGTKRLETKRCILRKYEVNDTKKVFVSWVTDEETNKTVSWDIHPNIKYTEAWIKEKVNSYNNRFTYDWVIELKETKELIGTISLVEQNVSNKVGTIGFTNSSKFWGIGLAIETLNVIYRYLLLESSFERIDAHCYESNKRCEDLLVRSGMKFEGIMRNAVYNNKLNTREGIKLYSIIKSDIEDIKFIE